MVSYKAITIPLPCHLCPSVVSIAAYNKKQWLSKMGCFCLMWTKFGDDDESRAGGGSMKSPATRLCTWTTLPFPGWPWPSCPRWLSEQMASRPCSRQEDQQRGRWECPSLSGYLWEVPCSPSVSHWPAPVLCHTYLAITESGSVPSFKLGPVTKGKKGFWVTINNIMPPIGRDVWS